MSQQATDAVGFVPPMPTPRDRLPGPLTLLRHLREDVLGVLTERTYRTQVLNFRLLSRRMLVINHPELVREVFVRRHETYQRKSRFMEQALAPVIGDSLFINHGEAWAERRAAVAAPLHPSATDGFHPLFVQVAEELAACWEEAAGGPPRDIAPDLAAATARVVMRAVFGPEVPTEGAVALARDFAVYQDAVESLDLLHLLGLPDWVPSWQRRTARAAAGRIRALVAQLLQAAPAAGGLHARLAAARREDGTTLLQGEALLNEIAMMLLAGSETSANALCWVLYIASAHAPTRARLRAEADAVLGDRPAPGPADLPALPYARAVIQEAMRLYPPVAVLSRQALAPDRIRRFEVPRGTMVACVPWLLHRNPDVWDAPHEFRPERFLAATKPNRFAYLPFGIGPRICAGAAFGMAESTVLLTVLLRRLDLAVAPGHRVMPRLRLTLRPAGGMPMLLTRRASLEVACQA